MSENKESSEILEELFIKAIFDKDQAKQQAKVLSQIVYVLLKKLNISSFIYNEEETKKYPNFHNEGIGVDIDIEYKTIIVSIKEIS